MKNKLLLLFVIIFPALQPVFCDSLEQLAGAEMAAALRTASEPITGVQLKTPSVRIAPSHTGLLTVINNNLDSFRPNLFVETLSLYQKPYNGTGWNINEQTSLFNQLVAISTLSGIKYYSESRKTMRTLYEFSHVIDSPAGKKPLPDPVFNAPPAALALYARQKDLTFGDNIFSFDYTTGEDAMFLVQENLTTMTAGIFPAVGKNNYRSIIAVINAEDSLLIYAVAMAKTVPLPGMGERASISFVNRVEAILEWFKGRADGVFKDEKMQDL